MRYLSLNSVSSACFGCVDNTTNQFWGLLSIIFAIDKEIDPTKTYTFVGGDVSSFLDNLFSLGETNKSDSEIKWFVIFSNMWKEYMLEKCVKNKPNIYDVTVWLYRKKKFDVEMNAKGILEMFLVQTHFKKEDLEPYFNFDERVLTFEDEPYSDIALKEKLTVDFKLITTDDNKTLSFERTKVKDADNKKVNVWSCIKYPAGNLTQAPFVQTLYSGQGIQKCLLLTKFDLDSLYKRQSNKNENKMNNLQVIYYGAPGTGKSHRIEEETEGESVIRTTFHPDSDYSTFVGAYKPYMEPTDVRVVPVVINNGISLNQNEGTYKESRIAYKFVKQAFLKAYLGAWKKMSENPSDPKPQYLIIEEINRGNCAQIFGDLFQLLDRDDKGYSAYTIDADTDMQREIAEAFNDEKEENKDYKLDSDINAEEAEVKYTSNYGASLSVDVQQGRVLLLPKNLFIWATMNTSDQSLFPIDSAFKRRWEWVYMPIKDHRDKDYKIEIDDTTYDWWGFLDKINSVINTVTNSEDKKLGYFFVKTEKTIDAKKFVGKVLFYLWNDVFKNYGFDNPIFNKEDKTKFAFSEFFQEDGSPETGNIKKFLENLDENINKDKPFTEKKPEETTSTTGSDSPDLFSGQA